jgi:hypothetical protein
MLVREIRKPACWQATLRLDSLSATHRQDASTVARAAG